MVLYSDTLYLSNIFGGKMANRKFLFVLFLAVFVAGWSFAQIEIEMEAKAETVIETEPLAEPEPAKKMPMNTITVDIGPTIVGAAIGMAGSIIGEEGLSSSGFGIAAQYERQILEKLTVAGRFSYLGGGLGLGMGTVKEQGVDVDTSVSMKISSFSLEGHARFYPWAKAFFLDGMLGYGNMSANFSGTVVVKEDLTNTKKTESISYKASRSYFKLGAKIGWRIDFGKPGGFVFEPSFGYYGGIGIGDTLGKKLVDNIKKDVEGNIENMSEVEQMFTMLENFIFVGGPRLSLAFGWRF